MKLSDIVYEIGYAFYKAINGGMYNFILTDNVLWIVDVWECTEEEMMEIYDASKVARNKRSIVCRFNEDGTIKSVNKKCYKYKQYFSKMFNAYENKIVVELDTVIV